MDHWAFNDGVHLGFIRPGRPMESRNIKSFNGMLPDECLNVEVFFSPTDACRKLALWLHDYNHHRPHSALADRTPAEFAAVCGTGNQAAYSLQRAQLVLSIVSGKATQIAFVKIERLYKNIVVKIVDGEQDAVKTGLALLKEYGSNLTLAIRKVILPPPNVSHS
jgi:hypothetical protein